MSVFKSIGKLEVRKCAIRDTMLVDNRLNCLLEDLVGGR